MPDLARIRQLLDERLPRHTLPQPFYTDPDIFAFDLEAIYEHSWIMVGLEVELPAPGSWLSTMVGRSSIVLVRDRAGQIRGYFNTCRHRGAQICPAGTGKSSRLVCPYHQWTYDLDGKLVRAGRMQETFDPSLHSLRPIHVETIGGTIYVCLSDDPPSFHEFRAAFAPMIAPHNLVDAKLAATATLVEKGNWKLVMENARECYHCLTRHPELSKSFPVLKRAASGLPDHTIDDFERRMEARGLPSGPVEGEWWQAHRFPLNEGYVSFTADGKPAVSKPMVQGDPVVGSLRWAVEPHSFCHAVGDYVFMFSAMPTAPQETVVTSKWFVHKDAVAGVDYDEARLIDLWNVTNDQDRRLVENNQRGVNSGGYLPGPYSETAEPLVLRFTDWYCGMARKFIEANS